MTIIYDIKQQVSYLPVDEEYHRRGNDYEAFQEIDISAVVYFYSDGSGVAAMAANNGPCEDEEWSFACVEFYNPDNNEAIYVYSFRTPQAGTTTSAKGAVYDKSTNTLTLTNCNLPDYRVVTNMMGDDFKIKLVGTSHVSALYDGEMDMAVLWKSLVTVIVCQREAEVN